MAGCARKEIVRPDTAQIFHIWQRCVRRAYLMGKDPLTGIDHSHRRQWLLDRLQLLVQCFVIDVGFTAILSNHFHLILRTSPRLAKRMGRWEVARRWLRMYPGKRVLDGIGSSNFQAQYFSRMRLKDFRAEAQRSPSGMFWSCCACLRGIELFEIKNPSRSKCRRCRRLSR